MIAGKINSKATGVIPKNIVTANDKTSETPEINPEKGTLEFTKVIIGGNDYVQGGNIVYELRITNNSKTFINDVSFVSLISLILLVLHTLNNQYLLYLLQHHLLQLLLLYRLRHLLAIYLSYRLYLHSISLALEYRLFLKIIQEM